LPDDTDVLCRDRVPLVINKRSLRRGEARPKAEADLPGYGADDNSNEVRIEIEVHLRAARVRDGPAKPRRRRAEFTAAVTRSRLT